MDTEERLTKLEEKLARYDRIVTRLVDFAKQTAKGRLLLAVLGVDDL